MRRAAWAVALPLLAQMGSPGGGETQAIALHPRDPLVIFAGAAKGLCKTVKGGLDNWPAVGLESLSPRALLVDTLSPDVIYAGTHESGVYRSADGGRTWKSTGTLSEPKVRAIAASGGAVYVGTDGGGVFRSRDGGLHWEEVNHGLIDKTVRALVADPRGRGVLYAGTWHGVYKSNDGGASWKANPEGVYDVDVTALAIDPTNSQILYAATNPRGVFRSTDGGATWRKSDQPLTEHLTSMAIDPHQPSHVYVGTRAGVFRSTDSAGTWHRAGLAWSNMSWTLVFDGRTNPATLYYGGVGGVLKTTNGGKWWDTTGPVRP
ncbi:MAG: hypothetical protein FJW39_11880 [Acidobacteria bacterium]|nr:hypothetical protein [Acidobacteriota bacterium]